MRLCSMRDGYVTDASSRRPVQTPVHTSRLRRRMSVGRLLDERRELLMQRLDVILEIERQGEGSIVHFQLDQLQDEFLFLKSSTTAAP